MAFGDTLIAEYAKNSGKLSRIKAQAVPRWNSLPRSIFLAPRPTEIIDLSDLLDWIAIASLKLGWVTIEVSNCAPWRIAIVQDSELEKRAIAKGITRWADLMDLLDTVELLNLFADEIEHKLEQTNG